MTRKGFELWCKKMFDNFSHEYKTSTERLKEMIVNNTNNYERRMILKTLEDGTHSPFVITVDIKHGDIRITNVKTGKTGKAHCHPNEEFDPIKGIAIAWARYTKTEIPEITPEKIEFLAPSDKARLKELVESIADYHNCTKENVLSLMHKYISGMGIETEEKKDRDIFTVDPKSFINTKEFKDVVKHNKHEYKDSDLFIFNVKLLDSYMKNNECLAYHEIEELHNKKVFNGKLIYYKGKPVARIFHTLLISENDYNLNPQRELRAYAYTVRHAGNDDIIEKILSGKLDKCCVGYTFMRRICSICGENYCSAHRKGGTYDGKVAQDTIEEVTGIHDIYFVED